MTRARESGPAWSVALLAVLVAAALAATGTAVLLGHERPTVLADAEPVTGLDVGDELFDDTRTVALDVTFGPEQPVALRTSGTVTASACAPGAVLTSGAQVAAVDGRAVVGLATATPLWRDLARGARGDDVASVQAEVQRLGHATGAPGRMDARTQRAVRAVLADAGWTPVAGDPVLPLAAVAWLPAGEAVVGTCPVALGSVVADGEAFAVLGRAALRVRVPVDGVDVEGDRVLTVGGAVLRPDASGVVVDEAELRALAATAEFAEHADDPARTLSGRLVLAEPVPVVRVPAHALRDERADGTACLLADGASVEVAIVASVLGQTLVRVPHEVRHVTLPDPADLAAQSCR